MQKEYTLDELVKSTQARINYNVELAQKAMKRGNTSEFIRFMGNAKEMLHSIEDAIIYNDKEILMGNRDW